MRLTLSPPLPRSFYLQEVHTVARSLLGKFLIRTSPEGRTVGRIVEVEAYRAADDSASHAYKGETPRNRSMFGPPGHAYVYSIHSRHCVNTVTQPAGTAAAVLIRALEPLEGIPLMAQRRGRDKLLELTRGPGRLCQAMNIDRQLDGHDLTRRRQLWIAEQLLSDGTSTPPVVQEAIIVSRRIGVTSSQHLQWRYSIANNRFVSGPRSFR